jgi:uncharacterized protein YndB with AHSA1/START domain
MDAMNTHLFRLATDTDPDAVWATLTDEAASADYLYGATLSSTWEAGTPLELSRPSGPSVKGWVLFSAPPNRLAYTLEDDSGAIAYLTWEVRPSPTGSVVRLSVDEFGDDTEEDAEDVWLPVLKAFGARLQRGPAPQAVDC